MMPMITKLKFAFGVIGLIMERPIVNQVVVNIKPGRVIIKVNYG